MHKALGINGTDQDGFNHAVSKGDAKPFPLVCAKDIGYFFTGHFSD
jgi:hypothetical protein